MKKILILFVGVVGLLLVSCDSGIDTIYPEEEEAYLPQIFSNDNFVETLTYDDQRRIVQLGVVGNDGQYAKLYTFFYSENKISTVTANYFSVVADGGYNYTEKFTFTYNGNQVKVVKVFLDSGNMSQTTTKTLVIDESGKIIDGDGITVSYDDKGNITKFNDGVQDLTLKYDDKNGVYKNLRTSRWVFYLIGQANSYQIYNNPVELVSRTISGEIANMTNLSYKYNEAGYPIEVTETSQQPNNTPTVSKISIQYLKIHHD